MGPGRRVTLALALYSRSVIEKPGGRRSLASPGRARPQPLRWPPLAPRRGGSRGGAARAWRPGHFEPGLTAA